MKDFKEGIRKAISNLSRAAEKCVKEYEKFEKYSNITLSEYEKKIEVKDTTGPPQIDKEKENPYLRMSAYPMEDFGKPDWKILDVDCLPGDILVGNYDFHGSSKRNDDDLQAGINGINGWIRIENAQKAIEELIFDNLIIRYRLTPTKKTHEELAEEYVKTWKSSLHLLHIGSGKKIDDIIKDCVRLSFIAGRKSMEAES